ncbi:MAG: cell wall-binding protein [Candidatus Paceibacter sp.]|nr:cell wall-binding protein [Candidatus Paceibacter sp.]
MWVSLFGLFITLSIFAIPAFSHAATAQEIITRYTNSLKTGQKVNILVVPGHDDEYWGTEFGDIREGDITVAIGQHLYNYLKADPKLNVTLTRTQMGYTDTFTNYFKTNRTQIQDFIKTSQAAHTEKISTGQIQVNEIVPHAVAKPEVALRLYGINKWANENNIDLVIHIHVNDEGSRSWGQVGKYSGFSMYYPASEYSNSATSQVLAKSIFEELLKKNTPSDYPPEASGYIPDHELIAIGAANTLKSAATLIEYGYIYEPKFLNIDNRDALTKDLAYQTYLGLHSFFGDRAKFPATTVTNTASQASNYLPHTWSKNLQKGVGTKADINALQAALTKNGVYTCGVTGTFGPCTEKGVKAFQTKYKISQTGTVGPQTRAKLNALYSK